MADAEDNNFPPVPKWQPDIAAPLSDQLDRMIYYTDDRKDIAQFKNGTMVVLPDGLNDEDAKKFALEVLATIFNYHPDMNPVNMDDDNILVQYNHPAYNVVISEFADKHMDVIQKNHLAALAESEVLMTPLGANQFDDFSKKALYGRAFMFMDAQDPHVVVVYRCSISNQKILH